MGDGVVHLSAFHYGVVSGVADNDKSNRRLMMESKSLWQHAFATKVTDAVRWWVQPSATLSPGLLQRVAQ